VPPPWIAMPGNSANCKSGRRRIGVIIFGSVMIRGGRGPLAKV
jgi:hypothetical protein